MHFKSKRSVATRTNKPSFSCNKRVLSIAVAALLGGTASAATAPSALVMQPPSLETMTPLATQYFPAPKDTAIPGRYIVVLKDQTGAATMSNGLGGGLGGPHASVMSTARELSRKVHGKVMMQYSHALRGFVIEMPQRFLPGLISDPRVKSVEQDMIMHIYATQNGATWGLDRVDQRNLPLDNNYTYTESGVGVNAYVIDTGILASHSNFGGRASGDFSSINDGNGTNDCNGHGTHVAGTLGSATYGVAKNVRLHAVRVLDCQGSGPNSGVIAGVDWVAQNRIRPAVANMSLGGGSSTALDNAVVGAINSGVVFAVAAGNSNSNACVGSPNRVAQALTVAASTISDARASFSSWGSCVDVFAPGLNITSTWNNGGTNTISGTSMASPHVAGAAALYLETHTGSSAAQVASALLAASTAGAISNPNGSPNQLLYTLFNGGGTPPPPPPPPSTTVLQNGVAATGLSGAKDAQQFFTLDVPAGTTSLSFDMSGGTGDADMYVKFGTDPTLSSYDCRPFVNGNNETCDITNIQTGTYHVMLNGFSAYSGVSLVGNFAGSSGGSFFQNTSNVSIPDASSVGPGSADSNINVTRTGDSGSIVVHVDIKHTYRGDLKITIIAPSGGSAVLKNTNSSDGVDNVIQDFNVNATGVESSGTWTLRVSDNFQQDTGFIDSWSITFQ